MAGQCQLDRLPEDLLRNIFHRAAVRLECTDAGVWALEEMGSYNSNSRAEWAQVRELYRLQSVSKHFHLVASTVKNLHCRINPQTARKEISGLVNFLSMSRCAESLVLTFGAETDWECNEGEGSDRQPKKQLSLFTVLTESQCSNELLLQAPCLKRFAAVRERVTQNDGRLHWGLGAGIEAASRRLLEALAENCPRLSVLALGTGNDSSSVRFPLLTPNLSCKPFGQLRRLRLHYVAQDASDSQGLMSLLTLCPNLLQLELDYARLDSEYLRLESDSLEVLNVGFPRSELTLDIRTPKLRRLKLGYDFRGAAMILAPNLSTLDLNVSVKVTVVTPWEQLERVILTSYPERFFVWDPNGPLHEALQGCSNLKHLAIRSAWIQNLSCLVEGLGSLITELEIPDRILCEVCENKSKADSLRELRKLNVCFGYGTWESVSESELLKAIQDLKCFPKLEILWLLYRGSFMPRAVEALLSLQKKRPASEEAS